MRQKEVILRNPDFRISGRVEFILTHAKKEFSDCMDLVSLVLDPQDLTGQSFSHKFVVIMKVEKFRAKQSTMECSNYKFCEA